MWPKRYALVIGNPHHPHPGEAWGICGGNRGLDFSLCPMGGGGLGQFRQLSSLMSNTGRRLGSTKCTRDSKWLTSKAQRSIRHQSIFKIYLSLVFDAISSVFTFDIIK